MIRRAWLPLSIVALAAALRLWGIEQSLPFVNGRPDEREALARMAGFPSGDLNPHWFVYPNLFFWTIWLWDEAVLAVTRLWAPAADFATLLGSDLPRLILYGRILSALAGTATVALTYAVAARAAGRTAGAIAALVVATNVLHVRDTHAMKSESFLALGTLACVALLGRWSTSRTGRDAFVAGAAIGVTTAFKYTAILLLVPAWLLDLRARSGSLLRRAMPSGMLAGLCATALGTFLAASPFLVLDYPNVVAEGRLYARAVYESRPHAHGPAPSTILSAVEWLRTRAFGYHVAVSLRRGCGLVLTVLVPFAVVTALRRGTPVLWTAAAYVVVHYLAIGASPVMLARYLTPIVPLLAILVAWLVVDLLGRIHTPALRAAATLTATLLLVGEPARASVFYDRIAAETDTRVLATRWMEANLPPGAVVARLGSFIFPIADPDLPAGATAAALPWGDTNLDGYGVTHVVTHQHLLPFSQLVPQQWNAIAPRLRLLAEFSPYLGRPGGGFEREDAYYVPMWDGAAVVRPGPLVRVWAVEPAP